MSTATYGEDSLNERVNGLDIPAESEDIEEELERVEPEKEQEPINGEVVEPEPVKAQLPEYCGELPPEGEKNYIKWALLHGFDEENLIDEGKNATSVRIYALELEREGLRKRPVKKPTTALAKSERGVQPRPKMAAKVFAHGAPPEAILDSMTLPDGVPGLTQFEKGIKFGAGMVMIGVRIAQELSAIGIQQAKPLVDMARDMRAGEAQAAAAAASDAAQEAAEKVAADIAPYMQRLASQKSPAPTTGDPMKDMVAEIMKPVLKSLVGQVFPGVMKAAEDSGLPSGWSTE